MRRLLICRNQLFDAPLATRQPTPSHIWHLINIHRAAIALPPPYPPLPCAVPIDHPKPGPMPFQLFSKPLAVMGVLQGATSRWVLVDHEPILNTVVRHLFQNWTFIARNQNQDCYSQVSKDDVLSVSEGNRYERIEQNTSNSLGMCIFLEDGSKFECSIGVLRLIELVNAQRTVSEVVELMSSTNERDLESTAQTVLETIQFLVENRVLAIDLN